MRIEKEGPPEHGQGPTLLMLAPRAGTCGAVPGIAAMLGAELGRLGWSVRAYPWGRRSEGEPIASKAAGRALDALACGAHVRRLRPDVLMVHTGMDWRSVPRDLALLMASGGRARRTVLMPHGSRLNLLMGGGPAWVLRVLVGALVSRCDGLLVLSEEERDFFKILVERTRARTVVATTENPFVPTLRETARESPVSGSGTPMALYVGRLVRAKGVFDLIDAMAVRDFPEFSLVMAGDGPDAGRLRAHIREVGVEDHVELVGQVSGPALAGLYAAATVFALPSYSEGFPTALAEAMSVGLPVVCTPVGGIVDRLKDSVNALFVPVRDATALRCALDRVVQDPALARRLGVAGRNLVETMRPATVARSYDEFLRDLLADERDCTA